MAAKGNDDHHLKRCNCKNSYCVKLKFPNCSYCRCFSEEYYCGDDCSCKEYICLNQPDFEDTVENEREKVTARNPFAFAPKIQTVEQPPKSDDEGGKQLTTKVEIHIKGCTCKNSKCSRSYCVCYKTRVGCSSECRCQGCQNAFGKKEEYNVYNPPRIMNVVDETQSNCENTEMEFNRLEISPCYHPNATTFQHPNHGNDTSTGSYIPSPISANNDMIGTSRREFDMVPFDQQSYLNVDQIMDNQFTPQEINEMMEWNSNDIFIDSNDNSKQLNIPSEPSIPSTTSTSTSNEHSSPENK